MDEKLKSKLPRWCFDDKEYAVALTDDIDSLSGCMIEKQVNGNEINYFYDFNDVYVMDKNVRKQTLGVDCAFTYGKCWDNHVTRLNKDSRVNPNSANINSVLNISSDNYYDKYCGGTALMMWSFYGLPLPETKLGKMLLLAIDVSFKGHYSSRFKDIHNHYLRLLGFEELIDLLNETKSQDYYDLIREYKLHEHIEIDDNGYLQTELPLSMLSERLNLQLELPSQPMTLLNAYKCTGSEVKGDETGVLKRNVISFALTNKKYCRFTIA